MIGCLTDPKKIHYMCSDEATSNIYRTIRNCLCTKTSSESKVAVGTATATWTAKVICTRPGEDGEANYRKEVPVRVFFWLQGDAELAKLLPSSNKHWRRPDRVV